MELKERIKAVRKDMGYKSQKDFADFLGVPFSNIASYESGRREPSQGVLELIASKCNVNEKWLKDNAGEMREPKDRDEELAEITSALYKADPEGIQYKLMKRLSQLTPDQWQVIKDIIEGL